VGVGTGAELGRRRGCSGGGGGEREEEEAAAEEVQNPWALIIVHKC